MTAVENKEYTNFNSRNLGITEKGISKILADKNSKKLDFFHRHLPSVERSDGTIEEFAPNRIVDSLISETSINDEEAARVTRKIVVRLINSNQKVISAQFIREQACDVLQGINPSWRNEYSRMGIPYRDLDMLCGHLLKDFGSVSDIDEKAVEKLLTEIDNAKVVQMMLRMFRDYVGTRNKIQECK